MSKFIKYLNDNDVKCTGIFHDHNCKQNALLNTYKFLFSNMKYFAPIMGVSACFESVCGGPPFE